MMKTKKWLCLLVFLLLGNIIFALSPPRELFAIRNSSNSNITVNVEFWYGPESMPPAFGGSGYAWQQTISGITLFVTDRLGLIGNNVIPSNREIFIIQYDAGFCEFDEMVAISINDKLNAIFKRLEIIHTDGRRIIVLEDFREVELKKRISWETRVVYFLEIFDLDDNEENRDANLKGVD